MLILRESISVAKNHPNDQKRESPTPKSDSIRSGDALMKLGGTAILPMVKNIAKKLVENERGAAILSPSGVAAKEWEDIAEHPETTKAVSERVAAMQGGETYGPLVLANRYDGIDLAGNACRFLVMDNLPQGTTNYDVFRMNVVADAAVNSLLAQRIEQGIGRGTRGGADYCVIVLVGSKLVGWIGRKKNLDFLTASTRVQLKMGQEVSEAVTTPKEVWETILKCLKRDPGLGRLPRVGVGRCGPRRPSE